MFNNYIFRCLRTHRPRWKWFINQDLVAKQPVVKFLSSSSRSYSFTGVSALSNGSKWIRSNVSYYGAPRAGQSHQTLYFDGCGHTDSHNHTYMSPFLPLSPHTSADSKAHKHTSWPGGREEGSQYLRSWSYLVPRSRSASHCRQTIEFSTMQLSACSVWAVLEVFTRHYVCWCCFCWPTAEPCF